MKSNSLTASRMLLAESQRRVPLATRMIRSFPRFSSDGALLRAAALVILAGGQAAKAEYYNFNTEAGSDILYQEIRYPYWAQTTYNARFYNNVQDDAAHSAFFYCGTTFDSAVPTGSTGTRINGYLWSFWPVTNPVNPGDGVTPFAWNDPFYDVPSIGEGASGKVQSDTVRSMTSNVWYPAAMRVWRPTGNPANLGMVGQWLKDGVTGQWSHIATMSIPFAATKFDGNLTGFLEDPVNASANPRRAEFRNIYYRKGTWQPATTFRPSTRAAVEYGTSGLMEGNTVGFYETCNATTYPTTHPDYNMGPSPTELTYTLATPPTPSFDPLVVDSVSADATGNQVHVKWSVPATSAPQFAYKVEVFATSDTSGTPAVTVSKIDPDVTECLVTTGGLATPTVRLTITDIFDKTNTPAPVAAAATILADATTVSGTVPGLNYKYYEASYSALPAFAPLTPVQQGAVNLPDLTVRKKHASYACQFLGYVNVPADGVWLFSIRSCDGSRLLVDGAVVVSNDGTHSGGVDLTGSVGLKAGKHSVEVQYFKSSAAKDNDQLRVSWEGPGVAKTPMTEGLWSRTPAGTEPTITLTAPTEGATFASASTSLTAAFSANGNTPSAVRFFNKDTIYATQAGTTSPITAATPLLGVGANHLKARLVCTRGGSTYTFDSPPVDVTVTSPAESPWTFSAIGSHEFQAAGGYSNGVWSMVGDNFNFHWQSVTGDETIICRTNSKPSNTASSQFDAVFFDGAWSGGLMFREDLSPRPGTEFGRRFVCLYKSIGGSTYLQSSDDANAGGYVIGPNLGSTYTWLKLQRAGTTFTAFGSTNGTSWTQLGTRTMATPFTANMHVGLFTLARPSTNPNPHWWKFDNVSLAGANGSFQLTSSPQSQTVYAGAKVSFSPTVTSNAPLAFQWQRETVNIPGATGATLTIDPVSTADAGSYRVVVSDGTTSVTSAAAILTVKASSATGYQRAVEIQGPFGYWRLNETSGTTMTDYVGARNGARVGSPALAQAGPRPPAFPAFAATNNAVQFSTASQRIEVPALNLNSNTVTMTGWIKRSGTQASFAGIFFSRTTNTVAGLTFGNANELRYTWNNSAGTYNWNSGLTPPDGVWTFVALVIEPTKATIYMDPGTGLVSATNSVAHAAEEFDGTLCFGQDTSGSTRTFKGLMDEVAIFNRSLSSVEIGQISAPAAAVSVVATTPTAVEQGPVNGVVTITRAGAATTAALGVNLAWGGTATADSDYTNVASVTIPAGATSVTVLVVPKPDALEEGPETVAVLPSNGAGYYVSGNPAMLTIHDKPWDAWRLSKFAENANNALIAGDDADPDGDGMNNLMEYTLNANPLAADPDLFPTMALEEGSLSLTYRKNLAATDVNCSVLQSGELDDWSSATVSEQTISDDGTTRVIKASVPTAEAPRKFLMLKVTH